MDEPKTCPYYKGVCGLDESYVCFCSSAYLVCSVYKEAQGKDVEQSLTELKNRCCGRFDDGTRVFLISENEIDGIIESLKKQQPKHGHWIEQEGFDGDVYYDCSVCGESWVTVEGTPEDNGMIYCPHCGAKMDEPKDGEHDAVD